MTILLAAGCSDKIVIDDLNAKGCQFKCDLCVNVDATCAEAYDLTGGDITEKSIVPGTPDVEIDLEIKR